MSLESDYLIARIQLHHDKLSTDCPVAVRLRQRLSCLTENIQNCSLSIIEQHIDSIVNDVKQLYEIVQKQQPKQLFASRGISGKEVVAKHLQQQEREALCRETLDFLEDLKNINRLVPASYRYGKISVLFNEPARNFSNNGTQEPIERLSSPRFGKRT